MKYWILIILSVLFLVSCDAEEVQVTIQEEAPIRINSARMDFVEEKYSTIGEVIPYEVSEAFVNQGALITEMYVKENDFVSKGDLLFEYNFNGQDFSYQSEQAGQISEINAKVNEVVIKQPVLRVVSSSDFYVEVMLTSETVKVLSQGDLVEVTLENNDTYQGELTLVALEADPVTRLYEGKITLLDDTDVVIGEYVRLTFVIDTYEAVLVPSKAIVRKSGEKYIFQYDQGELVKVSVETGFSKGDWIEITNMDSADFEFVISGQNFISEFDKVVVVE
jgi:multidrug efflux pump subunit AcrA (membrane-fusion protein)